MDIQTIFNKISGDFQAKLAENWQKHWGGATQSNFDKKAE
jgi:hypothetical protein